MANEEQRVPYLFAGVHVCSRSLSRAVVLVVSVAVQHRALTRCPALNTAHGSLSECLMLVGVCIYFQVLAYFPVLRMVFPEKKTFPSGPCVPL